MTLPISSREGLRETANPLGLQGIEFVEYACARPQAFGQSLERLGFRPVARHRSREVLLYRQGDMNIIVNAHRAPRDPPLGERASLSAVAFRTQDAARAFNRVLSLGGWAVPAQVEVMELNIPAIHGVGGSRLYFVDRHREFAIYDVDFVPIPAVEPHPPALDGLHYFGIVQYIGLGRMEDWRAFYAELFGFTSLPPEQRFGVMPHGEILASPCGTLYWQLIEPELDAMELNHDEYLQRVAFGTPDVPGTVARLRSRGVEFTETHAGAHTTRQGALTQPCDLGPSFEFVHDER